MHGKRSGQDSAPIGENMAITFMYIHSSTVFKLDKRTRKAPPKGAGIFIKCLFH